MVNQNKVDEIMINNVVKRTLNSPIAKSIGINDERILFQMLFAGQNSRHIQSENDFLKLKKMDFPNNYTHSIKSRISQTNSKKNLQAVITKLYLLSTIVDRIVLMTTYPQAIGETGKKSRGDSIENNINPVCLLLETLTGKILLRTTGCKTYRGRYSFEPIQGKGEFGKGTSEIGFYSYTKMGAPEEFAYFIRQFKNFDWMYSSPLGRTKFSRILLESYHKKEYDSRFIAVDIKKGQPLELKKRGYYSSTKNDAKRLLNALISPENQKNYKIISAWDWILENYRKWGVMNNRKKEFKDIHKAFANIVCTRFDSKGYHPAYDHRGFFDIQQDDLMKKTEFFRKKSIETLLLIKEKMEKFRISLARIYKSYGYKNTIKFGPKTNIFYQNITLTANKYALKARFRRETAEEGHVFDTIGNYQNLLDILSGANNTIGTELLLAMDLYNNELLQILGSGPKMAARNADTMVNRIIYGINSKNVINRDNRIKFENSLYTLMILTPTDKRRISKLKKWEILAISKYQFNNLFKTGIANIFPTELSSVELDLSQHFIEDIKILIERLEGVIWKPVLLREKKMDNNKRSSIENRFRTDIDIKRKVVSIELDSDLEINDIKKINEIYGIPILVKCNPHINNENLKNKNIEDKSINDNYIYQSLISPRYIARVKSMYIGKEINRYFLPSSNAIRYKYVKGKIKKFKHSFFYSDKVREYRYSLDAHLFQTLIQPRRKGEKTQENKFNEFVDKMKTEGIEINEEFLRDFYAFRNMPYDPETQNYVFHLEDIKYIKTRKIKPRRLMKKTKKRKKNPTRDYGIKRNLWEERSIVDYIELSTDKDGEKIPFEHDYYIFQRFWEKLEINSADMYKTLNGAFRYTYKKIQTVQASQMDGKNVGLIVTEDNIKIRKRNPLNFYEEYRISLRFQKIREHWFNNGKCPVLLEREFHILLQMDKWCIDTIYELLEKIDLPEGFSTEYEKYVIGQDLVRFFNVENLLYGFSAFEESFKSINYDLKEERIKISKLRMLIKADKKGAEKLKLSLKILDEIFSLESVFKLTMQENSDFTLNYKEIDQLWINFEKNVLPFFRERCEIRKIYWDQIKKIGLQKLSKGIIPNVLFCRKDYWYAKMRIIHNQEDFINFLNDLENNNEILEFSWKIPHTDKFQAVWIETEAPEINIGTRVQLDNDLMPIKSGKKILIIPRLKNPIKIHGMGTYNHSLIISPVGTNRDLIDKEYKKFKMIWANRIKLISK